MVFQELQYSSTGIMVLQFILVATCIWNNILFSVNSLQGIFPSGISVQEIYTVTELTPAE